MVASPEYHPGGVAKLMEGAGKDCTDLFNKYHRWVNMDSILGKCLVGTLIEEQSTIPEEEVVIFVISLLDTISSV